MRTVLIIATLAGMLAGALACGGGGSDKEEQPTGTIGETAVSDATPVLDAVSQEFADLLDQGLTASFVVTYETSSPDGEEGDVYVIFNDPPHSRIDTQPAADTESESTIIGGDASTDTFGCSGGPDQWTCENIAPLGDSLLSAAGPIAYLQPSDLELFDISETAGRSVAGQEAQCYALVPREGSDVEAGEYCFNSEGIPLYTSSSSGTVEAIELSREVSPEDFEPPAEPE